MPIQILHTKYHHIGFLLPTLLLAPMVLSGCAQSFTPQVNPVPVKVPSSSRVAPDVSSASTGGGNLSVRGGNAAERTDASKLSQCTRELEALKHFAKSKYTLYQVEFARITSSSAAYLDVARGISSDINDLVRPRYQYALTSLCYRIKNDLSTALINQVGTHG